LGRSFVLGVLTGSAVGLVGFSGAVMMMPAGTAISHSTVPLAAESEAAPASGQPSVTGTDVQVQPSDNGSDNAGIESEPAATASDDGEAEVAAAPITGEEAAGDSAPENAAAAPLPESVSAEPEAPVAAAAESAGSDIDGNEGAVVADAPSLPEQPMPADSGPAVPGNSSAPSPDTSAPSAPEVVASGDLAPESDPVVAEGSAAITPPVVEAVDAPGAVPEAAPSVDTEPPAALPAPVEITQQEPETAPDVPGAVAAAPEAEETPASPSSGPQQEDDAPEPLPIDEADIGDGGAGDGLPPGPRILTIEPSAPIGVAGAPKPGFGNGVAGVRVGRLPTIGDTAPTAEADVPVEPGQAAPENPVGAASSQYAYPFENPDGAPVVGVILLDDGSAGEVPAPEALGALGLHVTIAVDPTSPDAAARAQTYRLSGQEVAILVPSITADATASDFEVAYQAYVAALPESVAVIAEPDAALNRDRRMAQHLVALLGVDGRGLITYDKGLNPGRQAAAAAGLPSAGVFRVLDDNGENAATIRRILDRAAFEADRSGQVLVLGHLSTATVDALADWVAGGGKGSLIAPASALLASAE
jgi:polysaccharide deacetylase 2 family uncharacterized protein YibQ